MTIEYIILVLNPKEKGDYFKTHWTVELRKKAMDYFMPQVDKAYLCMSENKHAVRRRCSAQLAGGVCSHRGHVHVTLDSFRLVPRLSMRCVGQSRATKRNRAHKQTDKRTNELTAVLMLHHDNVCAMGSSVRGGKVID